MSLSITPRWGSRTTLALRWAFGAFFITMGIVHLVLPAGLPGPLEWMYDLNSTLHLLAGTAEILGGLGLILPPLVGRAERLTAAAAAGLALVMIGAAVWHLPRGEWPQAVGNLFVAWILATLGTNEWRQAAQQAAATTW